MEQFTQPVEGQNDDQETAVTHSDYILDAFSIVRRHEQSRLRPLPTEAMVLAYYNTLNPGDTETDIAV